jgi:hypothetical protein
MREYLQAWDHIPEKHKTDWEIGKLAKSTEKHFVLRDKYQEWAVLKEGTSEVSAVFYYTPVTSNLRKNASMLGNYLHSPNIKGDRSLWWTEFRVRLDEIVEQLQTATTGTLLGPAMFVYGQTQISMLSAALGGLNAERVKELGRLLRVKIDYLDALPSVLPAEAIVWRPGK